jgi:hypothetical protein
MTHSIKLIASMVVLMAAILITPGLQAQSNAEKLPGVMEKNGTYLFTALKMSPADQTALLNLLKENGGAYNVSVNTAQNVQSYGRLAGVSLKMKEIAGNKLTTQATTTCHTVSTAVNCVELNTVADLKALSATTQAAVKNLIGKYLK